MEHPIKLVDVGCGYGDLLRKIERWAGERGVLVELIGVDVNAHAVRAAREATPAAEPHPVGGGVDACMCAEAQDADIVTMTTVTHHLSEDEIVRMLQWMERTARLGWMVNDLHRMPVPYRIFSVAARGPWWHRFIRPDGLKSIRRSFVEEDWERMCAAAGAGIQRGGDSRPPAGAARGEPEEVGTQGCSARIFQNQPEAGASRAFV